MRRMTITFLSAILLPAIFVGVASAQTYTQPAPQQQQQQPAPTRTQPAQPAPQQQPMQPTRPAQPGPSGGQYPNVSTLKPFSAEADFMSLAGYLRYLVHQQAAQWLTYAEAVRIVAQQRGL